MPNRTERKMPNTKRRALKSVSYAKWGYLFIAPFLIAFLIFQLFPLLSTFYYSFFKYFDSGLDVIGPEWVGLQNYADVLSGDLPRFALNTIIIWIVGFIPQLLIAMLLAILFTSYRLKLRGQKFFKTVMYMPNLIMAASMAMLFFMLFSPEGPIIQIIKSLGVQLDKPIMFFNMTFTCRGIIAFMNTIMWFGNTTILLMAGIMGIDQSLFESAQIDGAKPTKVFFKITLPLLMPILVYVLITSMIGGIQMFDVPQVLTNRLGTPDRTTMTLLMYLNRHLSPNINYGAGGAISVIIFIFTSVLSFFVYRSLMRNYKMPKQKEVKVIIAQANLINQQPRSMGGGSV